MARRATLRRCGGLLHEAEKSGLKAQRRDRSWVVLVKSTPFFWRWEVKSGYMATALIYFLVCLCIRLVLIAVHANDLALTA